jgi:hypothetical protein
MGILGALQLLEEKYPDEKDYLPTLRRNAERLRDRVENLLELSRADAGALRVRLSEVDFENFVYLNYELLKERVRQAGFSMEVTVEPDLPRVCADPRRLGKVFETLVMNAVKFSAAIGTNQNSRAKISVRLSMETVAHIPPQYFPINRPHATGMYLIVSIASKLPSIGEKPDSFEQLFEPFSPWRDVDTRTREGLGVELALAREIMLAHSGFIWAADPAAIGEGWVFRFALPVLSREQELDLIINNRLYSGMGGAAKVSLLLIQPMPIAAETTNHGTKDLAAEVRSLLFRASDALFWIPETGELTILMDDCDANGAERVGERLVASLRTSLPNLPFVWAFATGPDHGADAKILLARARASWRTI